MQETLVHLYVNQILSETRERQTDTMKLGTQTSHFHKWAN